MRPAAETSREFLALQSALAGRYALDREIGRGGMGVVFLARDASLERPVAIKLLLPHLAHDASVRERFLREAQTAARLMHPNIVPIHAVDAIGELVFFVMAFVDGETLAHRVARMGPLPGDEVLRIVRDVAWALGYAHAHGVVHRDIKPDNVLIERDSGRAMVADFGIARVEQRDTLTSDGAFVGTIQYMSPEQASAEAVDGRTDVYSLGATAYFALTGTPPVVGPTLSATLHRLMTVEPEAVGLVRSDLPDGLAEIVMRALAKQRDARYAGAEQMAAALQDADRRAPSVRPEVHAFLRTLAQSRVLVGIGVIAAVTAPVFWWANLLSRDAALTIGVGGLFGGAYFTLLAAVAPLVRLRQLGVTHDEVIRGVQEEIRLTNAADNRALNVKVGPAAMKPLGWVFGILGTINVLVTSHALLFKPWDRGTFLYTTLAASVALAAGGLSLARGGPGSALITRMFTWQPRRKRANDNFLNAIAWLLSRPIVRKLIAPLVREESAVAHSTTAAPTATLLLQRVEDLVKQLPIDVRARLGDAVSVASALERASAALRQRLEATNRALAELPASAPAVQEFTTARDRTAARLADCVAALDLLRTDLLRLNAGLLASDALTLAIERAEQLGAAVNAELYGVDEVKKLLA